MKIDRQTVIIALAILAMMSIGAVVGALALAPAVGSVVAEVDVIINHPMGPPIIGVVLLAILGGATWMAMPKNGSARPQARAVSQQDVASTARAAYQAMSSSPRAVSHPAIAATPHAGSKTAAAASPRAAAQPVAAASPRAAAQPAVATPARSAAHKTPRVNPLAGALASIATSMRRRTAAPATAGSSRSRTPRDVQILAASGAAPIEIAVRTRMPVDAISLLLSITPQPRQVPPHAA